MATRRAPRRATFWLGNAVEVDLAAEGNSGIAVFGPTSFDTDETATLVGIIGRVAISCARTDVYTDLAPGTEAGRFGVGLSVQGTSSSGFESIDLLTASGLGDERLIWTDHWRIDATAHALPFWDGSAPVEVIYSNSHLGQYPAVLEVRSRAMRKFSNPTTLAAHFSWGSVTGLDSFDSAKAWFFLRAIFKAS